MITSRKTQQDVRLRLDRLDYELLKREIRDAVREELEAHERRKVEPQSGYWYARQSMRCACGSHQICVGYFNGCGLAAR